MSLCLAHIGAQLLEAMATVTMTIYNGKEPHLKKTTKITW